MKVSIKRPMATKTRARAGKPSLATVQAGNSEPINLIDAALMTAMNRATALVLLAFSAAT